MSFDSYRFNDKDPIIDVLRTLVETYASMEGVRFSRALTRIQDESHDIIKAATLRSWFSGPTRYPQYQHVARLALFLRRYSRRPIAIGDRKAHPAIGAVRA